MPDWEYRSQTCNGNQVVETWRVYCGEGETVCGNLGCNDIASDLANGAGIATERHRNKTNPYLTGFITGVGYPYVNRPCDRNVDSVYLQFPDIGELGQIDNRCCREVTLTWEVADRENDEPQEQDDDETQETDNWCPEITSSSVERIEAARRMVFGGLWQRPETPNTQDATCCDDQVGTTFSDMRICGDAATPNRIRVNTCAVPQASNGEPYDANNLQVRRADRAYNFRFFRACRAANQNQTALFFDESVFDGFVGKVNCDAVTLRINCRCWQRTFPVDTLMITSIQADMEFQEIINPLTGQKSRRPYAAVSFGMLYREEGWNYDILNHGTRACVSPGAGIIQTEVPTDENGHTYDHAVKLDDDGALLGASDREWYTRWKQCCVDFSDVPVLRTYVV